MFWLLQTFVLHSCFYVPNVWNIFNLVWRGSSEDKRKHGSATSTASSIAQRKYAKHSKPIQHAGIDNNLLYYYDLNICKLEMKLHMCRWYGIFYVRCFKNQQFLAIIDFIEKKCIWHLNYNSERLVQCSIWIFIPIARHKKISDVLVNPSFLSWKARHSNPPRFGKV